MPKVLLKHPVPILDVKSGVELMWQKIECESWGKALIIDGIEIVCCEKRYIIPIQNIIAIIE